MVFLSNLQVTANWITNLSLSFSSCLLTTLTFLFLSTLKFPNIGSVKHSFIEAQLFWIEIKYEYIHSRLAICHHQLKVKRKLNVNFNLNMKYDNVRVKQKQFNIPTPLITYCFMSTSSLPSTSFPPLYFSSSLLLEILKNWKEEGNNMHHKHMFSEIHNENCSSTEARRGSVLDSEQKIKTQLQLIWP